MENSKKTISDLNNKAWYRLLKVVYIIFFVVIFSVNNVIAFDYKKQLNHDKTMLNCRIGNGRAYSLSEANVYFSGTNFDNYTYKSFFQKKDNEFQVEMLIKKCTGADFRNLQNSSFLNSFQSIDDIQRFRDIARDNPTMTTEQQMIEFKNEKSDDPLNINIKYKYPLFDITPVLYTNYFIYYLVFGNFSIVLAFLIGQRIFYYIILGSLQPKKA